MNRRGGSQDHYFTAHPKSKEKLGVIHTSFHGKTFEFLTASGVFSKRRVDLGTRLLVESMILPEKGDALDVGCGYGVVGIVAASLNSSIHVVMVDVNARAVWLARQNIKLNSLDNAEVRRGELYDPVDSFIFSCILSNPPVSAGLNTVKRIIAEAPKHLAPHALFQIVVRSKIGGKRLKMLLISAFGNAEVHARKSGYRVLISEKQ